MVNKKNKKPPKSLNEIVEQLPNPIGRPTVYEPDFPQKLHDFLTSGRFFFQFAREINVKISTLYRWLDAHEDFKEAKKKGESARNDWWFEAKAVANLENPKFNVGLFCLLARNTSGWRTSDPREKEENAAPVINVFVNKKPKKDKDESRD